MMGEEEDALTTLTEEQIAEFREAFCLIDKNSDGVISVEELASVIQSLDEHSKREEIEEMMNEEIDFDDFLYIMATKINNKENVGDELKEVFRVFDRNQDGFISAVELRDVMIKMGERITDEEAHQMIREADFDGDGLLNYHEFFRIMMSSSSSSSAH